MYPIFVWNIKTDLPISNNFSLLFQCWSTNAFIFRCFCSKCHITWSRLSSSSGNYSFRICSDFSSSKRSETCTRKLGVWNSMGMTGGLLGRPSMQSRNGADEAKRTVQVWKAEAERMVTNKDNGWGRERVSKERNGTARLSWAIAFHTLCVTVHDPIKRAWKTCKTLIVIL